MSGASRLKGAAKQAEVNRLSRREVGEINKEMTGRFIRAWDKNRVQDVRLDLSGSEPHYRSTHSDAEWKEREERGRISGEVGANDFVRARQLEAAGDLGRGYPLSYRNTMQEDALDAIDSRSRPSDYRGRGRLWDLSSLTKKDPASRFVSGRAPIQDLYRQRRENPDQFKPDITIRDAWGKWRKR